MAGSSVDLGAELAARLPGAVERDVSLAELTTMCADVTGATTDVTGTCTRTEKVSALPEPS